MALTLTVSLKLPHIALGIVNATITPVSTLRTEQLHSLMVGLNKQLLNEKNECSHIAKHEGKLTVKDQVSNVAEKRTS